LTVVGTLQFNSELREERHWHMGNYFTSSGLASTVCFKISMFGFILFSFLLATACNMYKQNVINTLLRAFHCWSQSML